MMNFLVCHSSKTTKTMIAIPVRAIGLQMFRDSASLEKNAAWITSRPRGLSAAIAASSIDIQGHRVRTFNVAPQTAWHASHHHHDRIFDQHLEGADQLSPKRSIDRTVI